MFCLPFVIHQFVCMLSKP